MHREISHADQAFAAGKPDLSLYLLTGLLGLLIGADLWPALAAWVRWQLGPSLPTWPQRGLRLPHRPAGRRPRRRPHPVRLARSAARGPGRRRPGPGHRLQSPPSSSASRWSPPRSSSSAWSASAWKASPSSAPSGPSASIVEVCPRRCWLLRDGQEVRVLTAEVQVGDRVVVKPGARVPVDGVVLDGRSAVDVSALTGESLPVDKGPGDEVLAGSLNQFGALTVEARRVAEHTVVGRVIELTARALKDKAPLRAHRRPAGPLLPARRPRAGGASRSWPAWSTTAPGCCGPRTPRGSASARRRG